MDRFKVSTLVLDYHCSYLEMEKECFIVKKKDNVESYPLFEQEIGEVILKSGNMISAIAYLHAVSEILMS